MILLIIFIHNYTFSHLKCPRTTYGRSGLMRLLQIYLKGKSNRILPTLLWCRQMPTLKANLSEEGDADLWLPTKSATKALEMRNGVKILYQ